MIEQDFICSDSFESSGIVEWNSPSNIALVKYWGKKQIKYLKIHLSVLLYLSAIQIL